MKVDLEKVDQVQEYAGKRRIYLDIYCVGMKVDLELVDQVQEYAG